MRAASSAATLLQDQRAPEQPAPDLPHQTCCLMQSFTGTSTSSSSCNTAMSGHHLLAAQLLGGVCRGAVFAVAMSVKVKHSQAAHVTHTLYASRGLGHKGLNGTCQSWSAAQHPHQNVTCGLHTSLPAWLVNTGHMRCRCSPQSSCPDRLCYTYCRT